MRGITIAIFLLCVSVFGSFMATSGVSATLGVDMGTGMQGPADQVQKNFTGTQRPSERGGATGLLGFAVYAIKALNNFFVLYTSISTAFQTWAGGRFMPLWNGIQMIVVVIGTLMLVWVARGLIGE